MFRVRRQKAAPGAGAEETFRMFRVRFSCEEDTISFEQETTDLEAPPASTAAAVPKPSQRPQQLSRMFRIRRKASQRPASRESAASTGTSGDSLPWGSYSEDLDESPEPEREGKFQIAFSRARTAVDALSRRAMIRIMRDLLDVYSSARFQDCLRQIGAFDGGLIPGEAIAWLLRTSHRGVLSEHGLPEGEEGEIALVYLVSLFNTQNDQEGKALVNSIDDALFGLSSVKCMVVHTLRLQIRAFSSEAFQFKLASLLKVVKSRDSKEPEMHADGLPVLIFDHVLSKQKPILDRCGLPPNERGLRQLKFTVATYLGDPIVAKGVAITNALVGMDEAMIASFGERSIANAMTDEATIASCFGSP